MLDFYKEARANGEVILSRESSNWNTVFYGDRFYSIATKESCLDSSFGDFNYVCSNLARIIKRCREYGHLDCMNNAIEDIFTMMKRFENKTSAMEILLSGFYAGNKNIAKELFAFEGYDFVSAWNKFWIDGKPQSFLDFSKYFNKNKAKFAL